MARLLRKKSATGIYHVVMRGINRQRIFEDNQDYEKFLLTLETNKEKSGYDLYAFCLLSNHIHLLLKEGKEDLEISFRRIGVAFVFWYNHKYNRCGHLFQHRYRREAVETDDYFITVLRYIHQNPLKAGIVNDLSEYPWSSYKEYIGQQHLCDINFPLSYFHKDKEEAIKLFKAYCADENSIECLDYDQKKRWKDQEVVDFIINNYGLESPSEMQTAELKKRNNIIRDLKEKGVSIRQLERLSGISFGIIRKV